MNRHAIGFLAALLVAGGLAALLRAAGVTELWVIVAAWTAFVVLGTLIGRRLERR